MATDKRRKRKKKRFAFLKTLLITSLMCFSALCGIYCAKLYTTPYSEIVNQFHEDTLDDVVISKEKCNILIMGTDKSGMLTDVLMLAQIDPVNSKAVVMSIPRDTYIKYNGISMKINSVHSIKQRKDKKGSEGTILTVKELTGIPIHHFVKVNIDAFIQCIDELGGVEFDVPQRMYYQDPYQDLDIDLKKGMQNLNGKEAEQLIRFRQYPNGDIGRIKVQQEFMHALIEQKLQFKYIGKIDDIYSVVAKNIETSMTPHNMIQCGTQLLEIGKENITSFILPHAMVENRPYVKPVYQEIDKVREEYFGYDENGNEILNNGIKN